MSTDSTTTTDRPLWDRLEDLEHEVSVLESSMDPILDRVEEEATHDTFTSALALQHHLQRIKDHLQKLGKEASRKGV
jgi:hypothetical protein